MPGFGKLVLPIAALACFLAMVGPGRAQAVSSASKHPAIGDLDAVPYFEPGSAKARKSYRDFLHASQPRAFAIASSGAWGWATGRDHERRALENCQKSTRAPCRLYAIDDKVVFPFDASAASYADEDANWGVVAARQFRLKDYHAPTPTHVPGAAVISTQSLRRKIGGASPPVLIDALGGSGHRTLPGAVWIPAAGLGSLSNGDAAALARLLERLTGGDKSREIVAFCLSSYCWLSYNASLRLVDLGYTNVHWFRGGLAAWRAARLPLGPTELAISGLPGSGPGQERAASTGAAANTKPAAAASKGVQPRPALGFDPGRYFALVIGNNRYRDLPPLRSAVSDASAVAKLLQRKYGFRVTLLIDATRHQILSEIGRFRALLKFRDNLLIYYAGHGILDEAADRGYWLPVDAENDNQANWVSTADLTDNLRAMVARHILVVADSCYSGTLVRGIALAPREGTDPRAWLRRMEEKRSRTALTSGGLEPVLDGGGSGHSVFTKALLDALTDNTDAIDGRTLFAMLRRPVVLNAEQTPIYADIRSAGHDGGDFILVPASLQPHRARQ